MSEFKEFEHSGWEKCFEKYNKTFISLTNQTFPLIKKIIGNPSTATNKPLEVLDAACGAGYLAAELAGCGCKVTGLDFSSQMIAEAKTLFPEIKFITGDAENLDFPDESFDVITMNFGILHLEKPEQAIAEARRVLRPGGKFIFTAWTNPQESVGFGIVIDAVSKYGDPKLELPKGPPFFRFGDEGESVRTVKSVGFKEAAAEKVQMLWELSSKEEFFDAFYYGTARTGALLRGQDAERLRLIREEVYGKLSELRNTYKTYGGDKGSLKVPMFSLITTGVK